MTSGLPHRPSAGGQRDLPRGTGIEAPAVFPPGPSPAHPAIPLGRGWRAAGLVIGIVAVALLATVLLAERDPGPDYRTVRPAAIETTAGDPPRVTDVELQIDPADPDAGRVRVRGDGIVRVDVDGGALCSPVSGAPGAWIDVTLCSSLEPLVVTAHDIDDETATAVVRF